MNTERLTGAVNIVPPVAERGERRCQSVPPANGEYLMQPTATVKGKLNKVCTCVSRVKPPF